MTKDKEILFRTYLNAESKVWYNSSHTKSLSSRIKHAMVGFIIYLVDLDIITINWEKLHVK